MTDRDSAARDIEIISITGASRSGTTLLALLLGRLDGVFAAGELRYIWSRGYIQNELCGCGTPFQRCQLWQDVLEEAYGSLNQVPIEEITNLHKSVVEMEHFPQLVLPMRRSAFEARLQSYLAHLGEVCRGISKVTGCTTIVDSSKFPSFCYLLSRLPETRLHALHLVRDSRAVAFSFLRRRRKPEIHWKEEYMRRFSPVRSARDWDALNVSVELIKRRVPYQRLRYEDLVHDPEAELSHIDGLPGGAVGGFSWGGEITFATNHMVAGNPLRFVKEGVRVSPDTEWQMRMKKRDIYVVTAMTWPLLLRYGYNLIGQHPIMVNR